MGNLILAGLVKYLEAHPDQVVMLFEQLVDAGIKALKAHNAKAA